MTLQPVTKQVDSRRPLAWTCKDASLVHIYPIESVTRIRHLLGKGHFVLGRGDECEITIRDHSVSRRHVRFDLEVDGYVATDLESTNGTFVNDTPAKGTHLEDGDYLRVGNCLFRFLAGGNVEADYHEELYKLAIIDGLTGLHNKRYLMDYLDRELARAVRYGRPLALIILDIDHFKRINDRLGHLAGDLTLRELAGCLRSEVRRDELMARYGGEEFAVVLTETDHERATELAERLRRAAESHVFTFEGCHYEVTLSLGVATMTADLTLSPRELIQRVDQRLYQAKHDGRNRVVS